MAGKVRWGILATGWIAELFAKDLNMHGHTVAAVGSRSQASADRFAAQFGIPKAHPSYEALCADPEVDAIYVATPHPMHAENAKLALANGKHVLIEKAFTVNAREAQEIVDLAASKGLVVLEAMWTRFLPHMLRIREIVASGVLGEIRSVIADHTQDLPDDPAHRLNALELGGGALLDLGIYPISFTFDVLGAPKTIVATARFKATGADGNIATMFTYDSGAIALTLSSSDTAGRNIATIHGTDGRIEIDKVWYAPTSFRRYDSTGAVVETYTSSVTGRGMQYQAAELERLVAAGETAGAILPPSESVAIMACMDTIRAQIGLKYPSEA
ncbi:MAG: Gfo/Idh/MocA family oxidoreductase [Devosia sp.]|uniref:Gfo/Idh/MocA family protein n=1 Tax=Devosia sp. TaxID=1871048 RepID=UPI002618CB42|nr:Gfo/Idh/MocA family oxidoreductase [Devosia sp.]MDB5538517.1 Gfo/Idh/MocA family oxidoreductase [Devosia sp.]